MDQIRIVLFGLNYSNTVLLELFVATLASTMHVVVDTLPSGRAVLPHRGREVLIAHEGVPRACRQGVLRAHREVVLRAHRRGANCPQGGGTSPLI